MTADAAPDPLAGPGATPGIKQDVKYAPSLLGAQHPDLQRWRFASSPITAADPTNFTISCAAVPGKVLQPLDGSTASGIAVVLADPTGPHTPIGIPNPWTVTSPLLPHGSVNHQ